MYYYTKWNTPQMWSSGNITTVLSHNQAGLPITKVVGNSEINRVTETLNLKDSSIQYFHYVYDDAGRISRIYRTPVQNTFYLEIIEREVYRYDNMNRLLSSEKWKQNPTGNYGQIIRDTFFTISYNKNLIASNSAVGNYTYNHPSKPHALTQVEPFDETTISANTCDLTYTAFNKVKTINEGDYFYDIKYYPNKNQAVTTLKEKGIIISQKQYAGKAFEIDYATNTKYFYVYALGQPIAVFIQQGENAIQPYFIHTDYIGSIDKITDKDGNVVDSMSFDAWGNRRNRLDWSQRESNITHLIDRGFTMHQHLDVFNLINMGGRVYDPDVQQFLSPDPYVQMPDNTQNLNRYAYCLNSPTMYVDPTGEKLKWWQWLLIGLGADALTGGAISLTAAATATAASAAVTSTAATIATTASAMVTNTATSLVTAYNTALVSLPAIQSTASIADFTVSFTDYFFTNNTKRLENFFKIEFGALLHIPVWETSQTQLGNSVSHFRNMINQVDNVEIDWSRLNVLVNEDKPNTGIAWGFTLGPYINSQNIEKNDDIYQHESGHTMQSRILGPFYLTKVGVSSFMSFQFGNDEYHNQSWYEVWASRLGGAPNHWREWRENDFWYWSLISILPIFPK